MKVVYSFSEFKSVIKAGEKDILLKGCSKKLLEKLAFTKLH